MINTGTLHLLPAPLVLGGINALPDMVVNQYQNLDHFICENVRTARRLISSLKSNHPINEITFFEIGKHADKNQYSSFLKPCQSGIPMGLLSENGLPAIADPGKEIVRLAHQHNIPIIPYPGPSSLMMALMSSGLNGQQFQFHGYLPVDSKERRNRLKTLERNIASSGTQMFIEAPFRNNKVLSDCLATLGDKTLLCIACNILDTSFSVRTMSVAEWKRKGALDYHKKPAVFLIGS